MPKLTVDGRTADVPEGQRLVLAIESEGVPIGHRCGGFARCTTSRVEFSDGEPDTMTKAEYSILSTRELLGQVRLSCQIVCDHDMSVHAVMTKDNQEAWTLPARRRGRQVGAPEKPSGIRRTRSPRRWKNPPASGGGAAASRVRQSPIEDASSIGAPPPRRRPARRRLGRRTKSLP